MKLRGRNKVSPEFSMSSMTDIVFLLLIFFMLTSNSPNALDILLPKAKGKSTNVQNVSISIKKNLEIYIDASRVREGQIEAQLRAKLAGQEEPTIILRAEEGVPIEKAVNIMDIANRNKYKVILAVRPR
ncbi:outer membrane transport energization protein ExbD [Kordia periserrulae]|uniref:Outer membrane transport energization protein ExbD n=1 Tax=Kordia periserrulae TaxID=701523 RepID=A0A2T6BXT4_9FLAO|nr:biopolymer transporter ExbD [Kordia periserrulae]PTX60873.1 outer membrane transport energization protein ExbD [Kordia periserrulae]